MSVPEPLRHKGRLEVHVKGQYLASYTIKILSKLHLLAQSCGKGRQLEDAQTDGRILQRTLEGVIMLKIVKADIARLWRENDRLKRKLAEKTNEMESALVELAELYAEQDDAIVELAEIVGGAE